MEQELSSLPTSPQGRDPILESFVALADSKELEIGLTLWVNGTVVTGTLIGQKRYFNVLADQVSKGSGVLAQHLGSTLQQLADGLPEPEEGQAVTWLHLRDTRILQPAETPIVPIDNGLLWRGKLDAVDGWAMGSIVRN